MKTFLTGIIKFFSLSIIIIAVHQFLPVFAQSYRPPRMKKQKPQAATLSGSRGSCPDYSERIIPLFPQTKNLTTTLPQPVFIFRLKSILNNLAYFSLVADHEFYPLYQQKIESANPSLLVFQVPEEVELALNTTYRLNFVIVCDETRPSHNWSVSTSVTRIPHSSISVPQGQPLKQALFLSQAGLWVDALELIYKKDLLNDSTVDKLLQNYQTVRYSSNVSQE